MITDEWGKILEHEKRAECKKHKNCEDCDYFEDCENEAILNDLDEW